MKRKAIIFDASTLINFSMNGLLDVLSKLRKIFNGKFLITKSVEYEIIKRPLKIKKYELGALRIRAILRKKILELPSSFGIKDYEVEKRTKELLKLANHTFIVKNRYLHLIDLGEASCLALSEILTRKGIKNVISIDERTTRMLCEKPENLHKLLETKLHTKIIAKRENFSEFAKFEIIRSCELAYIAYKNNLVDLKDQNLLDALLYAVKYKGCSVSRNEIEEMKRL